MAETAPSPPVPSSRLRRYKKAAALIRKWMAEDNLYDEHTWPVLEKELKDSAMRCGDTDEDSP